MGVRYASEQARCIKYFGANSVNAIWPPIHERKQSIATVKCACEDEPSVNSQNDQKDFLLTIINLHPKCRRDANANEKSFFQSHEGFALQALYQDAFFGGIHARVPTGCDFAVCFLQTPCLSTRCLDHTHFDAGRSHFSHFQKVAGSALCSCCERRG